MENTRKVFVEINAHFDLDGKIIPTEIIWEDGRRYAIDWVKDVRRAASLKAGGVGQRYTVNILNRERYLWYDECERKWFVERKGD